MNVQMEQDIHLDGPAVRLEKVGKAFMLDKHVEGKKPGFFSRKVKEPKSEFWALKDVSFEVGRGRALGILGLNGAGKSTLLRVISGILQPTEGKLHVEGHAQLLQLGAGFVPEISGRQNVIAYARTRGLSPEQIEERIAYVEQFADIGPFFDQPMKTYSSGMHGRVAFGNAFAADPEILIVDEALAVGDAVFSNKCFRKIQEIREKGTTILFTSHSPETILRFCDEGIVLHKGELLESGSAREAAKTYSSLILGETASSGGGEVETANSADETTSQSDEAGLSNRYKMHSDGKDRLANCPFYNASETIFGSGGARLVEANVLVNNKSSKYAALRCGDTLSLHIRVFFDTKIQAPNLGFTLDDENDVNFYSVNRVWRAEYDAAVDAGQSLEYWIEFPVNVAPGSWFMTIGVADGLSVLQKRDAVFHFEVVDQDHVATGPGWLDLTFELL